MGPFYQCEPTKTFSVINSYVLYVFKMKKKVI